MSDDVLTLQNSDEKTKKQTSNTTTPSRKISSSSRLINALTQFLPDDNDDPNSKSTGLVETKILSMWHNVKYGWSGKMKSTNFSKEQPVWLLGRCYHRKFSPSSSMTNSLNSTMTTTITGSAVAAAENKDQIKNTQNNVVTNNDVDGDNLMVQELGLDVVEDQIFENPWEEGIEGFKRDFFSRLWMTYRREFPVMNGSNYTSDCGWGCMLRSGQMLLAQALICHFLGRSWRWDSETQIHNTYEDHMHRKIIKWFGDNSSKNSPFSIHALVNLGQSMGKKPGDWYGPASVSYLLRQAVKQAAQENADLDDINVYVASDNTVYIQDILDECIVPEKSQKSKVPWQQDYSKQCHEKTNDNNEKSSCWKSLIILIPLKLGAEKLNPIYANCLKVLLSTEYCIGIIGGRPKHSLFFVGFQEDKLIHLDPHYCQEMVDVNQDNFPVHTFHCKSPRKLKITKIDPSCCIGFYCQTKADFDNFVSSVQMYLQPTRSLLNQDKKTALELGASGGIATDSSNFQSQDITYPLFVFSRGRNTEHRKDEIPQSFYKPLHQQLAQIRQHELYSGNSSNNEEDDDDETEEFVIL